MNSLASNTAIYFNRNKNILSINLEFYFSTQRKNLLFFLSTYNVVQSDNTMTEIHRNKHWHITNLCVCMVCIKSSRPKRTLWTITPPADRWQYIQKKSLKMRRFLVVVLMLMQLINISGNKYTNQHSCIGNMNTSWIWNLVLGTYIAPSGKINYLLKE